MKKSVLYAILAVLVIALFGGGYLLYQRETAKAQSAPAPSELGALKTLPFPVNVPLTDKDGKTVNLSDYKGKAVVVNFWATWCPHCIVEMPEFQKVQKEMAGEDVVFLFVDQLDGVQETKEKALQFIKEKGYDFNVLFDDQGKLFLSLGLRGIPDTFFLNKQGELVPMGQNPDGRPYYIHVGPMNADMLRTYIKEALKR